MGLLRFGALQFFVFPDCLRHLREVANQKRRSTATLASAPHVTRVHFWKKCRAPINIPIATKLRRLEVPFLESRTVGIFQSTDSHFGHRAISRYFFAFRRALRRRKPSKRMRLSGRDRTSSRRRGGFSGMGVTTRGGARACVVDTGSTATPIDRSTDRFKKFLSKRHRTRCGGRRRNETRRRSPPRPRSRRRRRRRSRSRASARTRTRR